MPPFRTLAALALCVYVPFAGFAASRTQEAAPVRFELPKSEYAEGDVVHATWSSSSALHTVVLSDGKVTTEFDAVEDKSGTKSVRVIATDAQGLARARVTYGVLKATQRVNTTQASSGAPTPETVDARNPLEGRSFTLERQARGFRVLDDNGARVAEGLARLVLEEEGVEADAYVLAGDRVARELAGRPLVLGVEIPLSGAAARAFVGNQDGAGDVRFVVTPRETRIVDGTRLSVFEAHCTVRTAGALGEPDSSTELRGELRFDAGTGRFHALQLEGVLSLESSTTTEGKSFEVIAEGPWSIRASARYEH
jgi:hypothetical protein